MRVKFIKYTEKHTKRFRFLFWLITVPLIIPWVLLGVLYFLGALAETSCDKLHAFREWVLVNIYKVITPNSLNEDVRPLEEEPEEDVW